MELVSWLVLYTIKACNHFYNIPFFFRRQLNRNKISQSSHTMRTFLDMLRTLRYDTYRIKSSAPIACIDCGWL
jgi:hypothetical protein